MPVRANMKLINVTIMRRFRRDTRAVSNVIVAVLSLIILTIVVANVILWSYQMNQFDWERMQEDLKIVHVDPIYNSSWFQAQSEYSVNIGSLGNGTYLDTQTADGVSETFEEGLGSQREILRPNAAGQYVQWPVEQPSGNAHWDCCDEDPADDDGSYVESNVGEWKKEAYNLENHSGSGSINWVRIYVRARLTEAGTSLMRTLIRTYNNDYESSNISLSTSYQDVYAQYDTNPNTGVAWTWSEIDALEAGASSIKEGGDRNVRMTAVWMLVDYGISGGRRIDFNGTFEIDLSTFPLSDIQTVEIQLEYKANDVGENLFLEAYNWTTSTYSDSGFNNTSGHIPSTNWDIYAVNLTNKWRSYVNESGIIYVKLRDSQADSNQTTLDVDFLAVRAVINGAQFTFQNKGSLTCHLVSLWVKNSTNHVRYDIDIFINSGYTADYIRSDIILPNKPYIIRAVSERGNIAVYS